MQPTVGSYDQVQKALAQTDRESYGDLSYMPVFRASALFYAVVDAHTTTRVAFLNYWREKNDNPDIGVLITVRDSAGKKRARQFCKLSAMSYQWDVRECLPAGETFSGSIEVEAFSSQDLKFQFPGISVFYQTARGISYVHTNQRVYNNEEDRARGVELNPWQTGFDVDTAQYDPFIFLVNGPTAFAGGPVDFLALNAQGQELQLPVVLPPLPAYGAHDLRLRSVSGLQELLGAQPGICKINLPLEGVHLRLGVGNALQDGSWLSITHSYFDAVEHRDYFDTTQLPPDTYPAFIPFNLDDGLNVELVLYPIYARSTMALSLQAFDAQGQERAHLPLDDYHSPDSGLRRLNIRQLLANHGVAASPGLYVLHFSAPTHQLPARITYGLNYHVGGQLGTNISASAYLAKSWGAGKRSWRWGAVPIQAGGRTLIMLSAFSKTMGDNTLREGTVTLHDQHGAVAQVPFSLIGNSGVTLCAEDMLATAGYAPVVGDILWYVMESTHAALDVTGISIAAEGFVGGDHSF